MYRHKKRAIGTLDVAFKKRFLEFTNNPTAKGAMEAGAYDGEPAGANHVGQGKQGSREFILKGYFLCMFILEGCTNSNCNNFQTPWLASLISLLLSLNFLQFILGEIHI